MNTAITCLILPFGLLSTGYIALRLLGISQSQSNLSAFHHSIAALLGILIFSYYWFTVGIFGFIGHAALYSYWVVSLMLLIAMRRELTSFGRSLKSGFNLVRQSTWAVKIIAFLILTILSVSFARCFAFYIEGDSLVYHLYLPKQFMMRGAVWAVPFSEHVFWPLAAEMTFVAGEILKSLTLSKFISFSLYVALVAMVGGYVFKRTANLTAGLLAALLIGGSPFIFFHAPSTYNDIFYGAFLTGSFLVLLNQWETKSDAVGGLFLAGLLCGGAMSSKYLGLFGVGFLFLFVSVLLVLRTRSFSMTAKGIVMFSLSTALTGLPYYIRSFIHYGNPVFPFAQSIFQTPFGYGLHSAGIVGSNLSDFISGGGRGWLDFLALPARLTFQADLFGGDKIGYLFISTCFLIFFALKRNMIPLLFCLFITITWFLLSQYVRYLVPVFAVLAVMIGVGYAAMESKFLKISKVMLFIVLLLGSGHSLWAAYHGYKDYFIRKEDELILVAEKFNRVVSPQSKVVVIGDERLYYYDFVAFRERTFRNFTLYPDLTSDADVVRLLDEQEVSYLIMSDFASRTIQRSGDRPFNPESYFSHLVDAGYYQPIESISTPQGSNYTLYIRSALTSS